MKKMLQTRHRLSKGQESDWENEQVFSFDKDGNVSSKGAKFLQTINRDRYEIRWVPVKKNEDINEAVTLNVTTDAEGVTSNTTFNASDTESLVTLLKNAGVKSAMFNGPATLSASENMDDENGIATTITAPNLRYIMNMLEPEFKAVGDMEAELEDLPAEMDDDHIVDPAPVEEPESVDAVVDADGNLSLIDDDLGEEADYDYRTHEVGPEEYPGQGSKDIVQPDTKRVPARSGDNPIKSFKEYVEETKAKNEVLPVEEATTDSLLDSFYEWAQLGEKLDPSMGPEAYIHDFVHSKNPRFAGKSEDERRKMALGAYYAAKNESVDESELEEAPRGSSQWMRDRNRKESQYGPPFYMNTDMGYANLEMILDGTAPYWEAGYDKGFIVLEIERNGKPGLNYLWGTAEEAEGENVTAVTRSGYTDKFRPAKVVLKISMDELKNDVDGVVAKLAAIGVSPSKKLPVKGFD